MERPASYEITVGGQLDARWMEWFAPLALTVHQRPDGLVVTTLSGPIDQTRLHGVLARVRDLNLTLVAVRRIEDLDPEG